MAACRQAEAHWGPLSNFEDPSTVLGYKELFQRAIPVELRCFATPTLLNQLVTDSLGLSHGLRDLYNNLLTVESNDSPTSSASSTSSGRGNNSRTASMEIEMINVRVLAQAVAGTTTSVRVELSCDSSLFFHYAANITAATYVNIKDDCNLVVDFSQFPALLLKLLNLLVEQPATYMAQLSIKANGTAAFEFAQNLEFKCMSLLSMRVEAVPQAMVRGLVTVRHNALLERCADLQAELMELKALVRQRCPNLLQLRRGGKGTGSPAGSSMQSVTLGSR